MIKIIYVCHGNICRSPCAEYVAKEYIKEKGLENEFQISSKALSFEEIGHDIYYPMKEALKRNNIHFSYHRASVLTEEDIKSSDYIFYMDNKNYSRLTRYYPISNKFKLISYPNNDEEIEDPWYTERFDFVVKRIQACVKNSLDEIIKNINI